MKCTKTLALMLLSMTGIFAQTNYVEVIENSINEYTKVSDFNGRIVVFERDSVKLDFKKGYSNFERNSLIDDTTTFNIASVSKMITSIAILSLVDKGIIKLDDQLNSYYPKLPKGITIENLLNHTSGLQKRAFVIAHNWKALNGSITPEAFIDFLAKEPIRFSPNEKFEYNNTNYILLYDLFKKIENQSIEDYLISNEYFVSFNDLKNRAISYDYNEANGQWVFDENIPSNFESSYEKSLLGAGHFYINPKEAIDIVKAYKGFISKETYSKIITPSDISTKDEDKSDYGLGVRIQYDNKKNKILNHIGKNYGGRSYFSYYTNKDITLFLVTNTDDPNFQSFASKLSDIISNEVEFTIPKLSIAYQLSKHINALTSSQIDNLFYRLKQSNQFYISRPELNSIAFHLWEQNEREKSLEIMEINTKEFPENASLHFNYADGLQETGDYTKAIRAYNIAKKLNIEAGKQFNHIDERIEFCTSRTTKEDIESENRNVLLENQLEKLKEQSLDLSVKIKNNKK
ncbi:MAG: beta-lactamase family protein [Flavobacteriaceae bacterium]|nr:beta-lactamase family protein [Flavobacteriaceae bacterium]